MTTKPLPEIAAEIINTTSQQTGFLPREIMSPSRYQPIVEARWAVFLTLRNIGISLVTISLIFQGHQKKHINHATVIHGLRRAKELQSADQKFALLIQKLSAQTQAYNDPDFAQLID